MTTPSGMTVNYPPAPKAVSLNSGTMVIQISGTSNPSTVLVKENKGLAVSWFTLIPMVHINLLVAEHRK